MESKIEYFVRLFVWPKQDSMIYLFIFAQFIRTYVTRLKKKNKKILRTRGTAIASSFIGLTIQI